MSKQPIILIGGGGHCISCIDIIEQTEIFEIVGILDLPEKVGTKLLGYPIIGSDPDIAKLVPKCSNFLITIGQIKSVKARQSVWNMVKEAGGNLPTIISPTSHVSKHAILGDGTIIMHHALVNANSTIGQCCIINSKALIEHEATVRNFCHISTSACINGQAVIGDRSFIGSNAVIGNNLSIANDTIIAAGSRILKHIPVPGIYTGHPLRKIG